MTDMSSVSAIRPDPAHVRECREGADHVRFYLACPDDACRKAQRCQGALRPFGETNHLALPCMAAVHEEIFGPVKRWRAFQERVETLRSAIRAGKGPTPARTKRRPHDRARQRARMEP
jgi:hypothetical protein